MGQSWSQLADHARVRHAAVTWSEAAQRPAKTGRELRALYDARVKAASPAVTAHDAGQRGHFA